jgi:activator of 2-hydroxyglutaryl-CoA dehydratase
MGLDAGRLLAGAVSAVYDHQAAQHLGELLNQPVTVFPGGHNGNTTYPRAWAEHLRTTLLPR